MIALLLFLLQFTIPMHSAAPHGGAAGPTITHIQGCADDTVGSTSSFSCTLASPVTAGHFLYICTAQVNSTTTTFSGDSRGFTPDITNANANNGTSFATCAYVINAVGGGTTFTATATQSFASINVEEFAISGTQAIDVSGPGHQSSPTSSTAVSGDSITPTANGDLILGYISANNGPDITPGTGWTAGTPTDASSLIEFQVQTTAAAIPTTATLDSSQLWFVHTVAIK